jgi:PD-(D/E)XK nuclease superfamily protein
MRMAVSHTRLDSFENCPLGFKAKYIDKVPEPKHYLALLGGFFANWSKSYIDHLVETRQASDMARGVSLLEEQWKARGEHKEFKMLSEAVRFEARELVDGFLGSHTFEPARVLGTELDVALDERWEMTDWFSKEAFFRAKLDLATLPASDNGKVVGITDYKTGFAAWSEEETKNSSQLRRYTVAMRSFMPDADRFDVTLDFVRSGVVRGPYPFEPEVAEEEKASIVSISDRIESALKTGKWEPTPGAGCQFCPIFDKCPKRDEALTFRVPQTDEEAVRATQRLIMLETESKGLKEKLKVYAAEHGTVITNGMQYGASKTERVTYDLDELTKWAVAFGLSPLRLLKSDNELIEKTLKKLETDTKEKATAALAAIAQVKAHTEFRLKKFAGEDA